MDPSRFGRLQQGWNDNNNNNNNNNNNSAQPGYHAAVHDPNFRAGGSYDERRFHEERYSRENFYPRNAYPPPPPDTGVWSHSQSRRPSYEEEYPLERESRRHNSYNDLDSFRDHEIESFQEYHKFRDDYHGKNDNYRDHGYDRPPRVVSRDRDDYAYDGHDYRPRHQSREVSREKDSDLRSYDSDYDRGSKRDSNWRRRGSRDRSHDRSRDRSHDKRGPSWERDLSPSRRYARSRSSGRDDRSRSKSPRGRSYGRSRREDRYDDDDDGYERSEKRRDGDENCQRDHYSVAPSATVVVKGLSQKTTEEDLYQILAEWGPLRHVRVIKERNCGISRGFAFIDFPSVVAARAMMDRIGDDGLVVDGRKLSFEYSSKPTGSSGSFGQENAVKSGQFSHRGMIVSSDWMCMICGCVNFARRTSCFQCNEPRGEDAPPADIALSHQMPSGKKGSEIGPTHVLVVRGLDENADEEMLRYEFSKHAPIKDIRLVRDKFTHVSRGFAFVHFYSVEEAAKALEATNGTTLEKNGQILRVAYAKSIIGPGSGSSNTSQPSSLAAAAIEAAAFSQQYDAVGWAPKEYNPDDKQSAGGQELGGTTVQQGSAPQSGFVWDEASGYYYDAASGFYYDGNSGLYYDGNNAIWYSYDNQTQQYIPCTDQTDNKSSDKQSEPVNNKKAVISAPASVEKPPSLPDAVQAAANAAIAAEKKEKEKAKEIKLASKSSILANKKKMNNVLSMWKQRSHESQAPRVALDEPPSSSADDSKQPSIGQSAKKMIKSDAITSNSNIMSSTSVAGPTQTVSNSAGRTLMGVIRGSGRGGPVKLDTSYVDPPSGVSNASVSSTLHPSSYVETPIVATPFKIDASALGSYSSNPASGSGKRRFSETPLPAASSGKEQVFTGYRDRAAERRSLYGSSNSIDDNHSSDFGVSNRDSALKKGSSDPTPFPPGVGGRGIPVDNVQSYDIIPADKAIDENNVGNRMLRNMGWQEGLGLGKNGSGMVEPIQAQGMDRRAGLGSQQKTTDPNLEVKAGDSYRTLIQKKALARFREMSEP